MITHLALRVASFGLSLLAAAPLHGIVLSQETKAKPAERSSVPNQLTAALFRQFLGLGLTHLPNVTRS